MIAGFDAGVYVHSCSAVSAVFNKIRQQYNIKYIKTNYKASVDKVRFRNVQTWIVNVLVEMSVPS